MLEIKRQSENMENQVKDIFRNGNISEIPIGKEVKPPTHGKGIKLV